MKSFGKNGGNEQIEEWNEIKSIEMNMIELNAYIGDTLSDVAPNQRIGLYV